MSPTGKNYNWNSFLFFILLCSAVNIYLYAPSLHTLCAPHLYKYLVRRKTMMHFKIIMDAGVSTSLVDRIN